jgi:hypothetical protein
LILAAIFVLVIHLTAACGESESPGGQGASPIAETPTASVATPTVPPSNTAPTPASEAIQTVDNVFSAGATLIDLNAIVKQGKDGQPGLIVSVQRMRLGESRMHGNWASQDLSRRDDPDDLVWEVEMANIQVGHSCPINSTPEQCNWDHLVWVIHATTGETIGLRYPDTEPPALPSDAQLPTVADAIRRAHDLVPGENGQDARITGIWLLTSAEAGLGAGWGETTPIWQIEGSSQPPGPCMAPSDVEPNCPADHLMLHLHAITGSFLSYRLIGTVVPGHPATSSTSGDVQRQYPAWIDQESRARSTLSRITSRYCSVPYHQPPATSVGIV